MENNDYTIIEKRKIQLIKLITQLYDEDVLEAIEDLLLKSDSDWWHTIGNAEKQAIDEGLEDVKRGRIVAHEDVMKEANERYKD